MKVKSQSSISFFSDELNQEKYDAMLRKANLIRDFKNQISKKISANYLDYLELGKFDFLKLENTQIDGLTGQEIQLALVDIYTKYQNKFDKINMSIRFRVVDKVEQTYYKRNTKTHNKGDLKEVKTKFKSTPLCSVLGYIAKTKFTEKEQVIDYIQTRIDKVKQEKQTKKTENTLGLYDEIINELSGDRSDKVMRVAVKKRNLIFKRNQEPIEFKSLSYRSLNRVSKQIIDKNKNKSSEKEIFISLGGFDGRKTLDIPVTYSKKYHGKLSDYWVEKDGQKQVPYLVCFQNERVRIILTKETEREYCSYELDDSKILGVDVNIKHNVFACSDETEIDLNRNKLGGFARLLKRYDTKRKKCKTQDEKNKVIANYSQRRDKWLLRYKGELQELGSKLVNHAIDNGNNHIVMEDLEQMGRMFSKEEDTGIKYSRLTRIIHLNTLNDIVASICSKKGLQFSLVQASYTSQECVCGYVDKGNRLKQEDFACLECGHTENADIKSAKIIKRRVASDVHRNKLLKLNKIGWFVPKLSSYKQIKSWLLDLFEMNSVVIKPISVG
jgi:IS605 OrfB family transposase